MGWGRWLAAVLLTFAMLGFPITGVMLAVPGLVRSISSNFSTPGLSDADGAALREPYAQLAAGQDDALAARLTPGSDPRAVEAGLARIHALIPAESATSSRLVRWAVFLDRNGRTLSAVHEYIYPTQIVRADTTIAQSEGRWLVSSLTVNAMPRAQADAPFSLAAHSIPFVLIFVAVFAVPVFIYVTALAVLRRHEMRRRWLWLLFVLVGFTNLSVNGTTEAFFFSPIAFLLFGAGVTTTGAIFDPWNFALSLPIGAVAYWFVGRRQQAAAEPKAA
jgi:uncharacterized membrane protein YhaH (DUF805 family)